MSTTGHDHATEHETLSPRPGSRLGVSVSLEHLNRLKEVEELALLAEGQGFQSLWIPEAWGRDAFTVLALLAAKTTKIQLATGIVNIFSRTPAIVAQSIASLDDISNGRAILGLGASGPRVIEDWHGLKFEKVLERTREYVDVVRLILSGRRVSYDGSVFSLHDFRLGFDPPRSGIPIFLAATGPANVRLAGEIADGWLPIFANPALLTQAGDWLGEGLAAGGRNRTDVTVAAYIPTLLGGEESRRLLRRHVAFYVSAMGSYYFRLLVRSGWKEEAVRIREAWRAGSHVRAAELVTSDMLDGICISGTVEEAAQALQRHRRSGIDLPILTLPQGARRESTRATLEALGAISAKG